MVVKWQLQLQAGGAQARSFNRRHQRCDRSLEISSVESTPTAGMLAGSRRGKGCPTISCSEYALSNATRVPRSVTITGCCAA